MPDVFRNGGAPLAPATRSPSSPLADSRHCPIRATNAHRAASRKQSASSACARCPVSAETDRAPRRDPDRPIASIAKSRSAYRPDAWRRTRAPTAQAPLHAYSTRTAGTCPRSVSQQTPPLQAQPAHLTSTPADCQRLEDCGILPVQEARRDGHLQTQPELHTPWRSARGD